MRQVEGKDIAMYWSCLVVAILFFLLSSGGDFFRIIVLGTNLQGRVIGLNDENITIEAVIDSQVFQIKQSIKNKTNKDKYKGLKAIELRYYKGSFIVSGFNIHTAVFVQLTILLFFLFGGIKFFPIRFCR